jgi:hypothetical protein
MFGSSVGVGDMNKVPFAGVTGAEKFGCGKGGGPISDVFFAAST